MAKTAQRAMGALLLLVVGFGMSVFALALCDFETPESLIESAKVSFAYRYYDDSQTSGIDVNTGRFDVGYDRVYDTPEFGYTAWGATTIDLTEFVARSWTGSGSISYRYYLSEQLPLFVYAGARLDAATYQTQLGGQLRSGIGLGRLRDVTRPSFRLHGLSIH